MADMIRFTHTEAVLAEYAEKAQELYKAKLRESDRYMHTSEAPDSLINSVHTKVIAGGRVLAVDMDLNSYWKYVEWDTRPHWSPSGCLLNWITAKPVLPSPDKNGKIPTPKQLDFLVRRKIAREGTQGSHDLQHTAEELNAEYEQKIADAVVQDFAEATDIVLRVFAKV